MNETSKSSSDSRAPAGSVRILVRDVIFRGFGQLVKFIVERRRFDGRMQTLPLELYDTGDGAAILLYDPTRGRIVLVRQFRLPALVNGGHEHLIEVCAGKLEGEDPVAGIVREAEEETGIEGLQVLAPAIDLDVHVFHHAAGVEPDHLHLDVRHLVLAPPGAVPTGNHESHALRWVALADLAALDVDAGTERMARTALSLLDAAGA